MPRIIDADALIEWVDDEIKKEKFSYDHTRIVFRGALGRARNKIQSLAIETDSQGWCWDMEKAPKDTLILIYHASSMHTVDKWVAIGSWADSFQVWLDTETGYQLAPQAWRPLPPIPQKKEG